MELSTKAARKESLFIFIAITAGLVMRLAWTNDMEWKSDEKLMYTMAHQVVNIHRLPETGMMSGGGIVNPAFSVAPFALFACFTDTPASMNFCVQLANALTL